MEYRRSFNLHHSKANRYYLVPSIRFWILIAENVSNKKCIIVFEIIIKVRLYILNSAENSGGGGGGGGGMLTDKAS